MKKKRTARLSVKRIPKLIILHNCITIENIMPFSKRLGVPDKDRELVHQFRDSVLGFRGFKKIAVVEADEYAHEDALIAFDDSIEDEDIDFLDTIVYYLLRKNLHIRIEIITPLNYGEEPITIFMDGRFINKEWKAMSNKEQLEEYCFTDSDGNEIEIPVHWRFMELQVEAL